MQEIKLQTIQNDKLLKLQAKDIINSGPGLFTQRNSQTQNGRLTEFSPSSTGYNFSSQKLAKLQKKSTTVLPRVKSPEPAYSTINLLSRNRMGLQAH